MNTPRALVLRAPGINCERETAQACRLAGFATDLLHINTLLKAPEHLLDYDFLVIPGGFSYGDDLGAGTLLAKNLTIHLGQQLQQFIDKGRPILGICNGFQVLVRAGLLPSRAGASPAPTGSLAKHTARTHRLAIHDRDAQSSMVGAYLSPRQGALAVALGAAQGAATDPILEPNSPTISNRGDTSHAIPGASLTDNASAQFECRWVTLSIQPGPCIFTKGIGHSIELPIAHGEGRFVLADAAMLPQLQANGQIPVVYTWPNEGPQEVPYPYNPNGSTGNIAGICNAQGNVFGLMPHPERYIHALQHPLRRYGHNGQGDGLLIFKNAYDYAQTLQLHARTGIY